MIAAFLRPIPLLAPTLTDWVNHLWQTSLMGAAVLALLGISVRLGLSTNTRRALAWIALARIAFPLAGLAPRFGPAGGSEGTWLEPLVLPIRLSIDAVRADSVSGDFTGRAQGVPILLGVVWLGGAALFLVAWFVRGLILRRQLLVGAVPLTDKEAGVVAAAAKRAGLSRLPRCLAVDDTGGPGVLGLFSPVLVLPRGLEAGLTDAEFESVLIHEFVHIRRRDPLWGACQAFLASLAWYNPIAWVLNRRLDEDIERSCDERVVELTSDPGAYASGIIKTIRYSLGLAQPGFAGVATGAVVHRIRAILSGNGGRASRLTRALALGLGCLLAVFSGYAGLLAAPPDSFLPPVHPEHGEGSNGVPFNGPTIPVPIKPPAEPEADGIPVKLVPPHGDVFEVAEVDVVPVAVRELSPRYPYAMRQREISGEVTVDFVVDAEGEVERTSAASSSQSEFEPAALEAVSRWSFTPGRKNGEAVSTHMQVTVRFSPEFEPHAARLVPPPVPLPEVRAER
jgi:TonB family protein